MATDGSGTSSGYLSYNEPSIISILILISFFLFLAVGEWLADKMIRASLIGHIIVGLIYGVPVANILALEWQDTFLAMGYIGLILIIFEGGLAIRLDLLRQNLLLSIVAALIGVLTPIALSFALFYAGFHHAPLEAFILGTALCSTSLGTTFVVLSSASRAKSKESSRTDSDHAAAAAAAAAPPPPLVNFSQTRIGTVLVSAAVLDDVCGLVLVSVIHNLRGIAGGNGGSEATSSLGWIIGRPVLASGLMALLTPAVARFAARPLHRRFVAPRASSVSAQLVNLLLMAVVLCAFLVIAAYAGASVLFGAFLAGAFVSSLPGSEGIEETGEASVPPGFGASFEHYLGAPQKYVFQPLFFASVGFAIPFVELWTGEVIWKGVVYTLLMAFGKLIVGGVVPIWDLVSHKIRKGSSEKPSGGTSTGPSWAPATLLGAAMVARGEIGLLIIQIGLNETPFLTQKAFVIGVWAIVLNTILGPVLVGILLKQMGTRIAENPRWGVQAKRNGFDTEVDSEAQATRTSGGMRSLGRALA
ncbi:Sodium/hydrogen exchanger family-domain-containing protein [Corynascus novoguineensis]|uniref:Sodium/hydrogen exchanger family-domain-containing protein n=1 Tax=Corynascus novoguineensis TaxID=1126955 RepID=A0AAN7CN93_9PEZI|nr:Sodium/hydrogen exchanger family-domain-containing protein [Corynascus novoguineensis]